MSRQSVLRVQLPQAGWSCTWSRSRSEQFFVGLNDGSVQAFDLRFPAEPVATLSPGAAPSGQPGTTSGVDEKDGQRARQRAQYRRPVHSLHHLGCIGVDGGARNAQEVLLYGSMGCVGLWHRAMGRLRFAGSNTSQERGLAASPSPRFWSPSPSDSSPGSPSSATFVHTPLGARKACISVVSVLFPSI